MRRIQLVATLLAVSACAHLAPATTIIPSLSAVSGTTGAPATGLNGAAYLVTPINTQLASGGGGVGSNDGLSAAQAWISSNSPTGTYNATSFVYNTNDGTPLNTFLAGDSNGTAATVTTHINTSIFDATGYINIPTPGDYTFGASNSDDGSFVLISGLAVYQNGGNHGQQSGSDIAHFNAAGVYPIELLYFNDQYNGTASSDGMGGASVTFNLPAGTTLLTAAPAPVPEPASLTLFGIGLLGLAVVARRRQQ